MGLEPIKQSSICVSISDTDVKEHIRLAMAEVLAKDPQALMGKIIEEAFREKKDSYSKKTIIQERLTTMIREAAEEQMKEWLVKKKATLKRALLTRLNKEKGTFLNEVADKIIDSLGSNFYVSLSLTDRE